jgi:predicted NBD/HSP70 family sugar kinase
MGPAHTRHVRVSEPANALLQNKINTSVVFNYLRKSGPSDRARIARDLRLSAPTVSRIIDQLREDGYISEAGVRVTSLGKKAPMFRVNSERYCVIGIDLIKERVRTAVCDLGGSILECREGFRFTKGLRLKNALYREIDNSLTRVEAGHGIGRSGLKAIAVGVPAISNPATGEITGAILYESLSGFDLGSVLRERYSVPVFVDNVSNLSAVYEHVYGVGRGFSNLIFVEISRGVGAGMIFENNLYRGSGGSAGEIGFSVTCRDGLSYTDKNRGYLESKISLDAISESGRKACTESPRSLIAGYAKNNPKNVGADLVCRCAMEGDEAARRIIEGAADQLALIVVNLVAAISPEMVILGGDFCSLPGAVELFLDPIKQVVGRILPFSNAQIALSSSKENACVVGAATLAIESLLVGKYPYRI